MNRRGKWILGIIVTCSLGFGVGMFIGGMPRPNPPEAPAKIILPQPEELGAILPAGQAALKAAPSRGERPLEEAPPPEGLTPPPEELKEIRQERSLVY